MQFLKNKRNIGIIGAIVVLVLISVILFIVINLNKASTIEVQELYGEIVPYESLSFGDTIVAKEVFDSLVRVDDKFELSEGLAENYVINGNIIKVKLKKSTFKTPSGAVDINTDIIVDYYDILTRLSESDMLSNPGIENLSQVTVLSDREIAFQFDSQKATNILALTEYIGYLDNGKWYGTTELITYEDDGITVNNTKYINANSTTLAENVDARISTMIFANADKSEGISKENIPNGAFGFLTWGNNCTLSLEQRRQIFNALSNTSIHKEVELSADSIYADTELYQKANRLKATAHGYSGASLRVGVIDLGSYTTIEKALEQAFLEIKLPVIITEVSLQDAISSSDYDMLYIRLQRGKSPDFTDLFTESGFIGILGYNETYKEQISSVRSALTWEDMCTSLSELDVKLREDGVWFFVDQAFDIKTIRN